MIFNTMIQLQLQLFLLMILGFVCKKIHLINKEAQKSMSDLLIYVILPCNILYSFTSGVNMSNELLRNSVLALAISLVIQFIAIYGGKCIFKKWNYERASVANYGMIVSNSSFIGIPVVERIYGNIGVLYTAIFQIPIRFTMWFAGLALFTKVDRKNVLKKVIMHPCILACIIGFVFMVTKISLVGFVGDTVNALSRCTGPFSMIVIGAILADADFKLFFRKDVWIFCFVRLIVFPVMVLVILNLLGVDPILIGISTILTAMPAGSTTAILPQKYGCDATYGAALIFVSTTLSMVTIPLLGTLL